MHHFHSYLLLRATIVQGEQECQEFWPYAHISSFTKAKRRRSSKIDKHVFLFIDIHDNPAASRFRINKPSRLFPIASFHSGRKFARFPVKPRQQHGIGAGLQGFAVGDLPGSGEVELPTRGAHTQRRIQHVLGKLNTGRHNLSFP